ncbi:hypothetical protein GPJ56_009421 [Histomonas meleagridis]|uniref:uncharacterized protein n=1 Tax=Histomonas meleagridis TaxID=135588 RepID=UPI003559B896|nr:hypothetical protein GPJ56_009421 [Histomonas meleagridis]KAH0797475.1 hypothetical protein GO595_009796 [Histomonas meleagridis]
MELKKRFLQINEFCNPTTGEKPELNPIDVWNFMFEQAKSHINCFSFLFELFYEYSKEVEAFRQVPQDIIDQIKSLKNSNESLESKMKICEPLIAISTFLPIEPLLIVFDIAVEIVQEYFSKNGDFPYEFISTYDNLDVNYLEEETFRELLSHIQELATTEKSSSAIVIFSTFAHDLIDIEPKALNFIITTFMNGIESDRSLQISSCYIMEYISPHFSHEPESSPDALSLLSSLKPLLISNDPVIQYRSHKCVRELIKSKVFLRFDILKEIVSQFPNYSPAGHRYFFKLLKTYIVDARDNDDECDSSSCDSECDSHLSMEIIQYFYDIAISGSKTSGDDLLASRYIDLLADLSILEPEYFEDLYKETLEITKRIVNDSSYESFRFLTPFLIAIYSNYQEESFIDLLPKLSEGFLDETKIANKKHRILLSIDIAQLIGDLKYEPLVPSITNFIIQNLESECLYDSLRTCGTIIGMYNLLTLENAIKIFEKLPVNKLTKTDAFDMVIHVMIKLAKKFDVSDVAQSFVTSFINGTLPIFEGYLPYKQLPQIDSAFDFIEVYVKRFPLKSNQIITTFIEWVKDGPELALHQILSILTIGINNKIINLNQCIELSKLVLNQVEKLDKNDSPELISSADFFSSIYKTFPKVLDPISNFTKPFENIINSINLPNFENDDFEEEEKENIEGNTDCTSSIIKFLLNVYTTDKNYEINEKTILHFFDFVPFPKDEGIEEVFSLINEVILQDERFDCIKEFVAILYAQLLIEEDDELELDEKTMDEMKDVLKNLLKGNLQLKTQVASNFRGAKARMFRNLIK